MCNGCNDFPPVLGGVRDGAGRAAPLTQIAVSVFNWRQGAARFTSALRVLDFTGGGRRDALNRVGEHDVVLTTYGTLRRAIGHLKEIAFDYAILDEAQAIKNPRTSSAKAARLLKADHRLALSGTPVENHLGELWSPTKRRLADAIVRADERLIRDLRREDLELLLS